MSSCYPPPEMLSAENAAVFVSQHVESLTFARRVAAATPESLTGIRTFLGGTLDHGLRAHWA